MMPAITQFFNSFKIAFMVLGSFCMTLLNLVRWAEEGSANFLAIERISRAKAMHKESQSLPPGAMQLLLDSTKPISLDDDESEPVIATKANPTSTKA